MLAGRMKLRHFLMIAGGAGLLCAGSFFALPMVGISLLGDQAELDRRVERAVEEVGLDATKGEPNPPDPAEDTPASGREIDTIVLGWQGKGLGNKKLKDVTKGKPFKVNLYQDDGNSVMNRAKVDLDRDDKWDEKWTFDGPNVSRKVAPADDENHTELTVWNGSEWVAE